PHTHCLILVILLFFDFPFIFMFCLVGILCFSRFALSLNKLVLDRFFGRSRLLRGAKSFALGFG
ncbi:hypothetical protein KO528_19535, partial [Saccharophagus degradans]|uniref:hypothetical protein n=1 Tax=Saccharophagus degradans TaxID=86304 RepID=UPI001C095BB3